MDANKLREALAAQSKYLDYEEVIEAYKLIHEAAAHYLEILEGTK
jgi:hypothetical protein